ncbi:hypothetical protein WUBG_04475 [Wuchereria bancrofti]|uniref:Uncharacterized protein n=1 Tax=Wuchereria bancrofti TaxID=6293 RepID=J9F564_WUCBA|nr:hypothetical protein WUBG_04475 [Wuchereria bancrofti]
MPVVLPPPNPSQKTACLLYMEAFDIIIPNSRLLTVGSEGKNKYSSEPDHYKCNVSSIQGGAYLVANPKDQETLDNLAFYMEQNGYNEDMLIDARQMKYEVNEYHAFG